MVDVPIITPTDSATATDGIDSANASGNPAAALVSAALSPLARETLYFRNCIQCTFKITKAFAKIFIENCQQCEFEVNVAPLTNIIECFNSSNIKTTLKCRIAMIQIDNCKEIQIVTRKFEDLESTVWCNVDGLKIVETNDNSGVEWETGNEKVRSQLLESNDATNQETDTNEHAQITDALSRTQFIVRYRNNGWVLERMVRDATGFASAESDAAAWEERHGRSLTER